MCHGVPLGIIGLADKAVLILKSQAELTWWIKGKALFISQLLSQGGEPFLTRTVVSLCPAAWEHEPGGLQCGRQRGYV